MAYIKIDGFLCERCWHRWAPKQLNTPEPKNCPKCKSPYWNKPRRVPAQGNPAWRTNKPQQEVA